MRAELITVDIRISHGRAAKDVARRRRGFFDIDTSSWRNLSSLEQRIAYPPLIRASHCFC
jgi:hypothetical protein